ncbi:MAG: PocR ligand-binding domain-containing protein [Clostridia bacterium]|nr:PocR ligand-binding domain-containing protein [Clostridia bacterium]
MILRYDIAKLEQAMYDFNRATGVSITLYDPDEKPITSKGMGYSEYCSLVANAKETKHYCKHSNKALHAACCASKEITKHVCRAGLVDIAIPLLHHGELVGVLMIGQIRQAERIPLDKSVIGQAFPVFEKKYSDIPIFDEEKINSVISIGTMLTKYIMLENMVRSESRKSASLIEDYVCEHLSSHLSVSEVAQNLHMSVSGIYKSVKQAFGTTLGELITSKRIEKAESLLEDSSLSVSEISEAVGFSDPAHFSKSFKKQRGVSPSVFRKSKN